MNRSEKEDPLSSFSAMLRAALGDLLESSDSTFVEMLSDDAVMEFPFALPGAPRRLESRAAIAEYVDGLGDFVTFKSMIVPVVHRSTQAGVVILEFEGVGASVQSGKSYNQTYISVITLRDGHIVHYRDYWNPLVFLEAMKTGEVSSETSAAGAN